MALSDPQTITIDAVDKVCNRVRSDGYRSEYATTDEEVKFTVSHQETSKNGRTRHMVRIDQRVVAADPLSAVNAYADLGVYIVIDEPLFGFSDSEITDVVQALTAWCTEANIGKILGEQH